MDLKFLSVLLPMLFSGLRYTLLISIVGIVLGFMLGCISGFALHCNHKILKKIASVYIWIIRGTPLMVQALWVYFVLPKLFGFSDIAPPIAGILVIMLNSGAFISELVRGALDSVDDGQREAGLCLGLTYQQTLWHIIVPPAFKSMIPGLFNQFIISVKDTALLSTILVADITKQTMNYAALSFKTIPAWNTCAIFYLVLLSCLMLLQKVVEKNLQTGKR